MSEKSDQISCPTCEKIVFKRGLFGHLRFAHGKTPEEAHEIMSSLHEKTPEEAENSLKVSEVENPIEVSKVSKIEKLIEAQEEAKIQKNVKVQEEIEEDPEQGETSKLPAIAFIIAIVGIATIFLRRIDPRFKEITDELINKLEALGSKKSSSFSGFRPPGF